MSRKTTTEKGITIGQLAQAAPVNVETVRYYQRIGLLLERPDPFGPVPSRRKRATTRRRGLAAQNSPA